MKSAYFIATDDIIPVEVRPGIKRQTMGTTDEAMLCRFHLERGSHVPPHNHMNDQVGYLISGKLELTVGDETRLMTAGDSYAIPGGIMHEAHVLEDTITIDTFSPPRDDYRIDAL